MRPHCTGALQTQILEDGEKKEIIFIDVKDQTKPTNCITVYQHNFVYYVDSRNNYIHFVEFVMNI